MNRTAAAPAIASAPSPQHEAVLVAESPAMREVLGFANDVAPAPTTVLLLGESGTGKEVLARYIHHRSQRAAGPFVAIDCASLSGVQLESELFGHERGAFPGAFERRAGRLEQAANGTLLLDSICEMPLNVQARLLRALQERTIDMLGSAGPTLLDFRVIATSHRDLASQVRAGSFRADLYYRLNVFPIALPPLRERAEDVPGLAKQLLAEAAENLGVSTPRLTDAALAALQSERFPGNVRELRNLLERALVRSRGQLLDTEQLGLVPSSSLSPALFPSQPLPPTAATYPAGLPLDLGALERLAIEEALRRVSGNRTHAARLLGIGLRTLRNKLRQWREEGLPVPPSNEGGVMAMQGPRA